MSLFFNLIILFCIIYFVFCIFFSPPFFSTNQNRPIAKYLQHRKIPPYILLTTQGQWEDDGNDYEDYDQKQKQPPLT